MHGVRPWRTRVACYNPSMSPSDVTALRRTLGVNPLQLAELLGVPTRLVLQWEAGDRFPTKRHCEAMGALLVRQADAAQRHQQARSEPKPAQGDDRETATPGAASRPSSEVAEVVQALLRDAEFARRLHALVADYLSSSESSTSSSATSSPSSK